MRSSVLDTRGGTTWVLIFGKGDEVMNALTGFAQEHRVSAAHVTGIGAFNEVTLGFFDRERTDYRKIPIAEQVEVLSLVGDVALGEDGQPKIHAHVVVGKADGTAHGGHLLDARVWPTLELVLGAAPQHLRRRVDRETGLALIDLPADEGRASRPAA